METTVFTPSFSNTFLPTPAFASMEEIASLLPFGESFITSETFEAAKTPLDDADEDEDEDEDDDLVDDEEDDDDDLEDDEDLDDEEDDDLEDEDDDDEEDDEDDEDVEDDDPKPLRVKTRM